MNINRQRVREAFKEYTDRYDPSDMKIRLKIVHTYHVAENADEIARSLGLGSRKSDLAWLLGILHDLGRFEQVRRYNTFNDSISVSHAHLSCEVLFPAHYNADPSFFGEMPNGRFGCINDFIDGASEREYDIIRTAIWEHSSFRIPDFSDPEKTMFCNILRDADKIDIFRVNVEESMSGIYDASEDEINYSGVSENVINAIKDHSTVMRSRNFTMTYADHILSHACLAFELVYPKSREITGRQGYLKKLLQFRNENPYTACAVQMLRDELSGIVQC